MLGIEKRPLTDQFDFYACGDLLYCEASREYLLNLQQTIKAEFDHAVKNGGKFRDGSQFEPGGVGYKVMQNAIAKAKGEAE